ncbi:ribosomal protein S16 [Ceratocystis lukuohia]|uniref:Ribosomal protein S16 mitochondrial n=3 Tax=Ceratocystis TaxID=5157 RepID=A0A0F8D1L5_CERFI|nr:Ribosomal protein S16 mitochondrial [Ceratocystis platani]PHH54107.1 37S ribosomal protein S16, mitochondrial [Ceratocystis fimbriata CBS 114723]
MVVKIRLARFGRRNQPVYNIVVAQARTARNSRPLEVIGTYDPIPRADPYAAAAAATQGAPPPKLHKDIQLDLTRARYWLGVGAQPSEPAWRLLAMVGLLPNKVWGKPKPSTMPLGSEPIEKAQQKQQQ